MLSLLVEMLVTGDRDTFINFAHSLQKGLLQYYHVALMLLGWVWLGFEYSAIGQLGRAWVVHGW